MYTNKFLKDVYYNQVHKLLTQQKKKNAVVISPIPLFSQIKNEILFLYYSDTW